MKLTLVLSLWLALASSALAAQSSTDSTAKSAKAASFSLSSKFKNLAEEALDSVDRLAIVKYESAQVYSPAELETVGLLQRLRRAAVSKKEQAASAAIFDYFGRVGTCRLLRRPVATEVDIEKCYAEEAAARDAALRSLGKTH